MPASLFTETTLQNLKDIIASKGNLIRKALGVVELPVEVGDTKVSFPWFAGMPTPEEVKAYDHFICALCEMARNQKRVTAKERNTGNDKYAFRCFLLRLGFIGPEYASARKLLVRSLPGDSSFKTGKRKERDDTAPEAPQAADSEVASEKAGASPSEENPAATAATGGGIADVS